MRPHEVPASGRAWLPIIQPRGGERRAYWRGMDRSESTGTLTEDRQHAMPTLSGLYGQGPVHGYPERERRVGFQRLALSELRRHRRPRDRAPSSLGREHHRESEAALVECWFCRNRVVKEKNGSVATTSDSTSPRE